ncbi:hypothetical protein [Kitasatospora paranensis]|uniref:Lipoprotein n=1 Tax=Kitasatospora paranensis TaxID=258053 RepID=A0ABW2FLJ8_9ACTN
MRTHAIPARRRTALGVVAVLGAASGAGLAGCSGPSDRELEYAADYAGHPHLKVVGYPAADTLAVAQQVVWRLGDGEAGRLASMATSDGTADEHRATAANWVNAFGLGARGEVTADFYDAGEDRQTVVLYFHATGQVKDITMRLDGTAGEDGMRLAMREPDPGRAAAAPTWAPAVPGSGGSGRIG